MLTVMLMQVLVIQHGVVPAVGILECLVVPLVAPRCRLIMQQKFATSATAGPEMEPSQRSDKHTQNMTV